MAEQAVTPDWIIQNHWRLPGGQIQVRRAPEGFLCGTIDRFFLLQDRLIVETEWTAVQPFGQNPGLYGRPERRSWQLAHPTTELPDPTRFVFTNDVTVLSWPHEPIRDIHTAQYADLQYGSAGREVLIMLYPRGHEQLLPKP